MSLSLATSASELLGTDCRIRGEVSKIARDRSDNGDDDAMGDHLVNRSGEESIEAWEWGLARGRLS